MQKGVLAAMAKRCFVIMPFSTTSEKRTTAYWDSFFFSFVKPSVEKFGYSCKRSSAQPANIMKELLRELYEADLVLAVLTDLNANVWYELGIRHALRKGTIMMIEEGQKLPFDISQYGLVLYQDNIVGASAFEEKLKSFIGKIETNQPVDSPVIEFLGTHSRSEYEQRLQDMETSYKTKLDQIVQLLQALMTGTAKTVEPKEPKPKLVTRKVLWVDDYPKNNAALMDIFRQQAVEFDLALTTSQALDRLAKADYNLIISDMGRDSESDAGVRMIREILRRFSTPPPILIYCSEKHVGRYGDDAKKAGASLVTASPKDLMLKITETLNL
jgi:CheY-like chemotaxis protein